MRQRGPPEDVCLFLLGLDDSALCTLLVRVGYVLLRCRLEYMWIGPALSCSTLRPTCLKQHKALKILDYLFWVYPKTSQNGSFYNPLREQAG
ncbi:unnamed protein product [Citrullus colocynthis]|uniref:Uncharacterized protein n=1 Tax=Citrullus colocynthis TaxID=252529 RepID=A0ABP0YMW7_9ROSI